MPADPAPEPGEWFRVFQEAFIEAAEDKFAEVGIHYEKLEVRESAGSDIEWTHLMAIFLSRLARRMEYFQEWEQRGRLDLAWYEEDRKKPTIVIEHENWFEEIGESEVPKLLQAKADLRVLITYAYDKKDSVDAATKLAEGVLRTREFSGKFLLVIGTDKMTRPNDWRPFIWDDTLRAFVETSQGRSHCE